MTPPVDIDRIVAAMSAQGVELSRADEAPAAAANLNGRHVTFAALGSSAIVRAESLTDAPASDPNPAWYLAANHLNSIQMDASTTIVDHADQLVVRTEHEIVTAPGLNDEQLSAALTRAVDGVLNVHDAVGAVAEQFEKAQS